MPRTKGREPKKTKKKDPNKFQVKKSNLPPKFGSKNWIFIFCILSLALGSFVFFLWFLASWFLVLAFPHVCFN